MSLDDPLIQQLLLQLFLILLNAIFACAEIAVISTNDNKLEVLAASGDVRAKKLVNLTKQPAKFLSTIQVGITLAGFLGSAFAADSFSNRIVDALSGLPINASVLKSISIVLVTLILSYLTLIFGELVPKRLAQRKAEGIALAMAGFLNFTAKLFAPIVWLLTCSTNAVLRLLKIDPNDNDDTATEEDIRMMVDAGSEKGTIDKIEKEIIQNVFEFDDTTAEEIMTHRIDCVILWMEDDIKVWQDTIKNTKHSYYPICEESVDNITGILWTKDYFRLDSFTKKNILKNAVKDATFYPESIKLDDLFHQMKKSKNHFAVILDDYGGMSGVVTMNDLLEQIVGDLEEIGDAVDESEAKIKKISEDTWELNGYVDMEDVIKQMEVNIDPEDCETFGSYVFSKYGTIPDDGTKFSLTIENLEIKVEKIEDHCLEKAIVKVLPQQEN